jgi:AraC family transcriptional activator of pobA
MQKLSTTLKVESITQVHQLFGLPKPVHPLISLVDTSAVTIDLNKVPSPHVLHFYKISYRAKLSGKLRYGQGYYDFDEGGLLFAGPNQLIGSYEDNGDNSGYVMLIHPDFLLGYPLAKKIKQFGFFSYTANEALHLSDKEKETIVTIYKIVEEELNSRIDDFSQDVIISQLELLLNYANRFYKRQFITRKAASNNLLEKMEQITDEYFNSEISLRQGLPTVQNLAAQLHLSPSYLSDMLRSLTGQNAQQYLHYKIIEKAKEKLSTTELTVSEIAFELGFEHSQSFSKLFKTKTKLSPLKFRQSFS